MVLRKVTFQLLKGDLLHDESSPFESRFLFHCLFLNSLVRSDDLFLFYLSNIFLFTE